MKRPMYAGLLLCLAGLACSEGNGGGQGTGGQPGSGGAAATGGAGSGGATGSGGTIGTGGSSASSGGATGSGGATASGGVFATGGNKASGGIAGQASGGAVAGGAAGTAAGGRAGSGGATATGGLDGGPAAGGTTGTDAGGRGGSGGRATGGNSTAGGGAGGTTLGSGGATTLGSGGSGGATTLGSGGTTGAGGGTHTGKWQIMPLGDSITETTCYPKLLAQELTSKGHTNFDFVGTSLNNQGCGNAPNVQTEGHSCYLVTNLVKDVTTVAGCGGTKGSLAELKTWAAEKPDVVLMEYGTNDAWSSIATQSILDAFSTVLEQFRGQNPNVIFFVAQITPLNPSGCTTCEANVEALNAKIPAWASSKSTAASPVYVANIWASLPVATYTPNSTYTSDGCHPNPAGSQLMADAWYAALVAHGLP